MDVNLSRMLEGLNQRVFELEQKAYDKTVQEGSKGNRCGADSERAFSVDEHKPHARATVEIVAVHRIVDMEETQVFIDTMLRFGFVCRMNVTDDGYEVAVLKLLE